MIIRYALLDVLMTTVIAVLAALIVHGSFQTTDTAVRHELNNSGNKCRVELNGAFLPCSVIGPRNYPREWANRWQDV